MSDTIEQSWWTATVGRDAHRRLVVRLVVLAAFGIAGWLLTLAFGASSAHAETVGAAPSSMKNHAVASDDSSQGARVQGLLGRTVKTVDRAVQPVAKPVVRPVVKTVVKPVVKTVVKPVVKTVVKTVVKPVVTTVVQPVVKTVAPVVRTVAAPVVKTVVAPVVKTVVAPVVKTVVAPVVKTVVKPIVTTIVTPVVQHAVAAMVPAGTAGDSIAKPAAGSHHAAVPVQHVVTAHLLAPVADSARTADLHRRMSDPQPGATGNAPQSPVQPGGGLDPSGIAGGGASGAGSSSTTGGAGAAALAIDGAASAAHLVSAPVVCSDDTEPGSLAQPTGSSPD